MTSEIAKAGLMPSALHGVRCMGIAADETESFQDYGWKMFARQARRTFSHLAAGNARVRSDTHVQSRAPSRHGQKQSGTGSWTMWICTGPGGDSNDWWA